MVKVVNDRLMTREDRKIFNEEIIPEAIKRDFTDTQEVVLADPII